MALNSAVWGQSDAIYGGFVLLAIAAAFEEQFALMMIAFGVALSFKLQAALIGPFILHVVLSRRVSPAMFLILPLVYAGLMLPAWLAGRPALDLATIYLDQAETWHWLSMSAPNPWVFAQWFPHRALFRRRGDRACGGRAGRHRNRSRRIAAPPGGAGSSVPGCRDGGDHALSAAQDA